MTDAASVSSAASSLSISNQRLECPVCKGEYQRRAIFSHIRSKHESFFLSSLTAEHWLKDAAKGKPLKFMWEWKDDFDEQQWSVVYGCLSSNKAFQSERRCSTYFAGSAADLKEHTRQAKELLKRLPTKVKAKDPAWSAWLAAEKEFRALLEAKDPAVVEEVSKAVAHRRLVVDLLFRRVSEEGLQQYEDGFAYWPRPKPFADLSSARAAFDDLSACTDLWQQHSVLRSLRWMLLDFVDYYSRLGSAEALYKTEHNPHGCWGVEDVAPTWSKFL